MTIPNLLTLLRIFLTPLLVWFLLDHKLSHALVVFFIAGLTDGLDGLIARLLNQKSRLGAYLDPLADKLLLVSSFILLAWLSKVPNWLVVVTVSRDLMIVMGIATLKFHEIPFEMKPTGVSKITTLCQLMTVLALLASDLLPLPGWIYSLFFVATTAFSVVSGVQYVAAGVALFEGRHRNHEWRRH
ncbi:MAG: CDP-alcohol phosphatidyltransferase family protein [Syntrophobacteraceae bacterium]|jgi:cardiolipin synthase|nr:CDP-alcohol phosphatidyltransferase family protein [Syntrophobacteraceae bacterium]